MVPEEPGEVPKDFVLLMPADAEASWMDREGPVSFRRGSLQSTRRSGKPKFSGAQFAECRAKRLGRGMVVADELPKVF
jgi:hypothetical protein